jgi:hypothetical protein
MPITYYIQKNQVYLHHKIIYLYTFLVMLTPTCTLLKSRTKLDFYFFITTKSRILRQFCNSNTTNGLWILNVVVKFRMIILNYSTWFSGTSCAEGATWFSDYIYIYLIFVFSKKKLNYAKNLIMFLVKYVLFRI